MIVGKKKGKAVGGTDDVMVKRLDAILVALQSLLIIEGHDAGMTQAQVRTTAKVAMNSVGKVWKPLEAARKAREKKEKTAK
jgi:hypothetical protein